MPEPSLTVVLADDTPDIRMLLRMSLTRSGFEVLGEAGNGEEAVALATEQQPDVVLLDLAMPVMDGLQAIPLIQAASPATRIVVISGFESRRMEEEAKAAGADAYVEKGSSLAKIVQAVADVVGTPGGSGAVGAGGRAPARAGAAATAPRRLPDADPASFDQLLPDAEHELAFVLHELMSPLTVIEGFAAMLEMRGAHLAPTDTVDYASRIARQARHLRSLIETVADARRVQADKLELRRAAIDLAELVTETVADMASVLEPHPVTLDVADGVVVPADAMRIRQVLTNLLSNAAKFTPPEGAVRVGVRATDGGGAEIWVADEGPGVPEDRQAELFGRYARLDASVPGMGVGLYISRGIARAHRGDLVLAPSEHGQGACFVLTLPGR